MQTSTNEQESRADCTQIAQALKACPRCSGTSGHEHVLTEQHMMQGVWGEPAEAGDSGRNVRRSLVRCLDCGSAFNYDSLLRKRLL